MVFCFLVFEVFFSQTASDRAGEKSIKTIQGTHLMCPGVPGAKVVGESLVWPKHH